MSTGNQVPPSNHPLAGPAPDAFAAACPSRGLVARLGEKWALLTIVALAEQPVRFGALKRRMEGISAKMLGQTLRALERDGLVARTVLATRPIAIDYRLTDRGHDLLPLAQSLKRWAEANLAAIEADNDRFDAMAESTILKRPAKPVGRRRGATC